MSSLDKTSYGHSYNIRNDSLLHGLSELTLGNLLHFSENHGRNFLWTEGLGLAEVFDLDERRSSLLDDLEGPVCHVLEHHRSDDWVTRRGYLERLPS